MAFNKGLMNFIEKNRVIFHSNKNCKYITLQETGTEHIINNLSQEKSRKYYV